jgi:hypothetical protein
LQIVFGWSDGYLNLFHIHGQDYGVYHDGGISFSSNADQVRLCDFKFRNNVRDLIAAVPAGCVVFDDTIIDKDFSHKIELVMRQ